MPRRETTEELLDRLYRESVEAVPRQCPDPEAATRFLLSLTNAYEKLKECMCTF